MRSVEAVVRHRHFTRAAEELHVAQSALSHQIRQLERELGTTLFERTSRRVSATDAGQAIAARARRILAEVDGARAEVDELRGVLRGRVWVGPLMPAGDIDVPGLLARFSSAHPGSRSASARASRPTCCELAADELDAAFCLVAGEVPDQFAVEPLGHDEVVAVFAPGLAPPGDHVTVDDLVQHRIVAFRRGSANTAALEKRFADAGEALRLSLESGDPFLLRSLAARGFAVAILPRSLTALAGPTVEVRSLYPVARLPVALLWRRRRNLPPAARAFIAFVRRERTGTGRVARCESSPDCGQARSPPPDDGPGDQDRAERPTQVCQGTVQSW